MHEDKNNVKYIFSNADYNFKINLLNCKRRKIMGKGDIRTRRGKIFRGTYGKTRPHKLKKAKKEETSTTVVPTKQSKSTSSAGKAAK